MCKNKRIRKRTTEFVPTSVSCNLPLLATRNCGIFCVFFKPFNSLFILQNVSVNLKCFFHRCICFALFDHWECTIYSRDSQFISNFHLLISWLWKCQLFTDTLFLAVAFYFTYFKSKFTCLASAKIYQWFNTHNKIF